MYTRSITRSKLVAAVEAGIENAGPTLTTAEKIALRSVAATADQVARGAFRAFGCGCPLTQVGLNPDENQDAVNDRRLGVFFQPFDHQTREFGGGADVKLLKVVED